MLLTQIIPTVLEWLHAGEFFIHRGHRIFFRRAGHGPALLLLHGFPTASWDWVKLWEPLATRFTLIAPDMMGYGFSAKPPLHDYRIADEAELIEALFAHISVKSCHMLAHDVGDTVAQELLARALDGSAKIKLHSVCLLNGGLFPETHRPRFVQRLLLSPLGSMVARRTTPEKFARSMAALFGRQTQPDKAALESWWTLFMRNDGRAALPHIIRYITERRVHRERWVNALATTTVPLRLINGTDDPVSGEHMANRYRQLVPQADVVLLRGIGHFPHWEAPDMVLQAFLAFYDSRASHA